MLVHNWMSVALIITTLAWQNVASAGDIQAQQKPCPEPAKSPFRYVIAYNSEVENTAAEGTKTTFRVVDVLLDPNSFSELTLRQLFDGLSRKFPKSARLVVHVHTNLEDVFTPEEAEQIPSGRCDYLRGDKYSWAIYTRSNQYEAFEYSTNEPGSVVKTVLLKVKSQK